MSLSLFSDFNMRMNFRILCFLAFLISIPSFVVAQSTYGDYLTSNKHNLADEIIKPSVQSPDVAAFQKTSFIPTSNYTGRVNVTIPIYTIQYGGMEVPISISYNTSGVKVSQMSSRVGLNWSLNAGGVASKVIQGLDDFTYAEFLGYGADMRSPGGWLADLNPNAETRGNENPNNDALPDKYIINAPGLSTEFVPNKNGSALDLRMSGNVFEPNFDFVQRTFVNSAGNTVTSNDFALKSLNVTSISGIRYQFETPDLTNGATGGPDIPTNYLDKIKNLNTGQEITFNYESFSNYYYDDSQLYVTSYGGGSHGGFMDKDQGTNFRLGQRIRSIDFATGSVEFIYNHNRLDYPDEKALTSIVVKDNHGATIKEFRLSHSYFQSGIESGTPESKRLKLDEIYEVDIAGQSLPSHKFTYNTSYEMPPRDTYAYDFLGYNNGSYSSSITNPEPKMYFYGHKITPLNRSGSIELPGNYSMASSLNYTKTYSLSKIELPTGGSQEFDYELNQFSYKSQTFSGGGLRVKTQYLKAADGVDQIIDYSYDTGIIGLMPSYASIYLKTSSYSTPSSLSSLTTQLGIDTFSSPRSQIELNNGSFVAYRWVTQTKRNAGGYTKYIYDTSSNTESTKTNPSNSSLSGISNAWRNLTDGLLFIDNDFMRGLLIGKYVYDQAGDVIFNETSEYELQESSVIGIINQTFYNTVNNLCASGDDVFRSPYEYWRDCGGYKEVISLKPSRYVLKTQKTTDFALEGQESWLQDLTQGLHVVKSYTYDPHFPLLIRLNISNSLGYARKDITYPVTGSEYTNPVVNNFLKAQELFNQNRVSTPMEIEITGNSYSKQTFNYADFGSGLISLQKITSELREGELLPSAEVLSRDSFGNPTEIKKVNGKTVSIIYGYENTKVIAIIDGASYSSINSWLSADHGQSISYISQLSDNDNSDSSEINLQTWLDKLRSSVDSRGGFTSSVNTYTYDTDSGLTRATDSRGNTTKYRYDEFDRLKEIINDDSKLLNVYNYNYKK